MNDFPALSTLAEAERFAASQGIKLTASDREAIQKAQIAERQRLASLSRIERAAGKFPLVETFNRLYPRFLQALFGLGEVLFTLTQTLIIAFGIPVALVFLLIVEQQRVVHGIILFERDYALASFAATALVLLNLVLEFTIEYVEERAAYKADPETRFSLRTTWRQIAYIVGWGDAWRPQPSSPALRYKKLLRLVSFSILALALAGSMQDVIRGTLGAWYEAIAWIITQSSLAEMMTWIGGLLFAMTAVFGAQGLSRYIAIKCAEIVSRMEVNGTEESGEKEAMEAVAVQYVVAKVSAAHLKQNSIDVREVASLPPFSANHHGPQG